VEQLGLDLLGEVHVLLEELARLLAALPQSVLAVAHPGARALENATIDADVEQLAEAIDALADEAHAAIAPQSMQDEYFFSADGELLVVPQEGKLRFCTELGIIDVEPKEIAVLPRGLLYRVEVLEGPCLLLVSATRRNCSRSIA
jgi:cell division protein FtsB